MSEPKLVRQLGLFDATMIMVGIVIGSGIYLSTGIIAASIPSVGLILLAWVVGGLLTLAGAFTYAELGAAMPEAGGQYVYINKAYGEAAASLFTLRKKFPDLPRPYKAWGYPVVPILFILASVGILLNTLLEKPVESLSGLGMIAIGLPAYYFWKRRRKEEGKSFD